MDTTIINIESAVVSYREDVALRGVSLRVQPGDFVGIIGPNGAGKTTILTIINGMGKLLHGNVRVLGHYLTPGNGHYLRKGDIVSGEQGNRQYKGWVCGLPTDKTKAIAVASATGKRLAQCSEGKVSLIRQATGVTWMSQYIPRTPMAITVQEPIQLEHICGNSSPPDSKNQKGNPCLFS